MIDLSYTNKDGLNPAKGFTEVFDYHKDGNPDGDGYEHGGYPEITGQTSPYTDTSYKTGDDPDFFHNGNVIEQPEVNPEPPVPPVPPEEESDEYDYVYDEASWNESEANGALKKYHEKYPEEDWWNVKENRACNYNDRLYVGTIDGEEVNAGVKWVSDAAQSLTIDGTVYYGHIFYGFTPEDVELFEDAELTESTGKILVITEITYSDDCERCWEGAINNPGAKYPWVCPNFTEDVNAQVIFRYEGFDDVQPWGTKVFHDGGWGCESVAKLYGDDFDIEKFKMILKRG